ncbi:hypothetical protein DUT91_06665 [Phyllobacterium salinisoli]|uniref:Uncharacterized protein n=1 Tax=Phyllobacterium salinisoli TaxID=1899321 RepID=A0A368K9E0_9HYPH|nr:hypothetical protein [Phyllobacterium salinisoli]RCS25103.1 hypothetical protein DUT91_06665 [Phyllobacterium salinisoli]
MAAKNVADSRNAPPTVDRMREDIDRGSTREKVPYPDPAAAPMGTDEEAAGNPPGEKERAIEVEARTDPVGVSRRQPAAVVVYVLITILIGCVILGSVAVFLNRN